MNNILCIYPKDTTTEFLSPVYKEIISIYSANGLLGDPTEDDDYLEKLYLAANQADSIIFIGHGSSRSLYGINFNEIICEENENIEILRGKRIILFACKSIDFIRHFKFNNAIGFGLMPTSVFDTQPGKIFHNLPIGELSVEDLGYILDLKHDASPFRPCHGNVLSSSRELPGTRQRSTQRTASDSWY